MSLSVLPLSVASYLNDQYPDYPRNQIPEPFRDKEIKPETVCRESPYDLLALWGVFSSQAAYLVSYRSIPIKGSPMYHKAAYCVMEPRQLSTFKKVSALGAKLFCLICLLSCHIIRKIGRQCIDRCYYWSLLGFSLSDAKCGSPLSSKSPYGGRYWRVRLFHR